MNKNRKNRTEEETVRSERDGNRIRPGRSGNRNSRGSVKKTPEQLDALMEFRGMAPFAVSTLKAMLKSAKTPAAVKVKICEMILDRTYGKPEAQIRVMNVQETVSQSRDYVASLVKEVQSYMNGAEGAESRLSGVDSLRLEPGREAMGRNLPGEELRKDVGDQIKGEGSVV